MTAVEKKFREYLRSLSDPIEFSPREEKDFNSLLCAQKESWEEEGDICHCEVAKGIYSRLESQIKEAVRICETFFTDKDSLRIVPSTYPLVCLEGFVPCELYDEDASVERIAFFAATMIDERFHTMNIGGEYEVRVCYLEPEEDDVSDRVSFCNNEEVIPNGYKVIIEVELF